MQLEEKSEYWIRQTIAKRLKQAQENVALTTFNSDMSNIMEMRKKIKKIFRIDMGLSWVMSLHVKRMALKSFPAVNAEIDNEDIIYKNYYNISFAVGTEKVSSSSIKKC